MKTKNYLSMLGGMLLAPVCANAGLMDIFNFGPKVEVTIDHPPALPLKVNAVAIAKPEGQCSDEVGSRVEEDFVQSGVTVIDRQRLQEVLSEYKLQTQTMIDQKTAAKVGNLLGAQALLFIKVLDCRTGNRQDHFTDKKGRTSYTYYTQATISGSMRVVDLTTGRVMASQHFEGSDQDSDGDGYPDRTAVLGKAEIQVSESIHKLLLPWSEKKQLVFYDDKECDLATATRLLKAHDLEGAHKQSEMNITACNDNPKAKPATRARAYYNLGILKFVQRDYDGALVNLTEASKAQTSKAFDDAAAQVRAAKKNAEVIAASLAPESTPLPASAIATTTPTSNKDRGKPLTKPKAEASSAAPPPATAALSDRLAQLKEALDKKLITQTDYDQKKAELLKGL
jgi:hypothetical protein